MPFNSHPLRPVSDEDTATEIVNNGFLRVFKKIHTFAFKGSLEGYADIAGRLQIGYNSADFNALLNVHARDLRGTVST